MSRAELPRGWQWKTIGEVCRVIPGFAFKSKDWADSGIPVIKIKNIKSDCTIDVSNTDCVPPEVVSEKMGKFRLRKGDILIAMTGATAGKVGWLSSDREFLLNQRVAKLDPVDIEKRFFWGVISGRRYQDLFFHLADGAAQPNMSGKQIENVEIPVPPHQVQLHLASIVSAYDDLIENNTRRIEILEEMARRLYEEWFVHFRFPGHEEVSFKESELGRIPEEWEVVQLGELVREVKGTIPPSRVDPDTPYVGLEHIPRRSITLKGWSTADTVESSKLPFSKGDILFGKIRPYFHKVSVAPVDGICSSDTILLRAQQQEHFGLALCCASSDEFVDHATQTSNGTKMPRANWKVLSQYQLLLPNAALLKTFNNFVSDIVSQCRTLVFKNANLRAQRDLLLPKLVSGEIDVSDIPMPDDKGVEAA